MPTIVSIMLQNVSLNVPNLRIYFPEIKLTADVVKSVIVLNTEAKLISTLKLLYITGHAVPSKESGNPRDIKII